GDRRHFRALLTQSEEGIASNILADRLQRLTHLGMITSAPDPSHKQRVRLSLTEPAIQLVPVLAHLGAWGRRHLPVTRDLAIRAELLERGGQRMWDEFMDELREKHLGMPRPAGTPSVLERLSAAFHAERAALDGAALP
ncbi:winged helix-turn-helix transcriptional regulator, partial [Actinoplanes sp. NPDC051633]|uniref:winged helix-turn-helix transcriptional regulator n=1 Tax=Actinoplanes sp. NPDC051633 TaxID=3155670 RepID=UPI003441FAD6